MRNNKAILDEVARSVRRTFIGSVAGTTAMFAVIGAAGAYGMPEKLTAQALSAAMAKFNIKCRHRPRPPWRSSSSAPRKIPRLRQRRRCSIFPPEEPAVRTAPQVTGFRSRPWLLLL